MALIDGLYTAYKCLQYGLVGAAAGFVIPGLPGIALHGQADKHPDNPNLKTPAKALLGISVIIAAAGFAYGAKRGYEKAQEQHQERMYNKSSASTHPLPT